MLHKVLIDAVSNQATRLLMSEKGLPALEALERRVTEMEQRQQPPTA